MRADLHRSSNATRPASTTTGLGSDTVVRDLDPARIGARFWFAPEPGRPVPRLLD